jgi:hypothetical protein
MTKKSRTKQYVENPLEAIINSISGNATENTSEKKKKGKHAGELFPGQELNLKDFQENNQAREEEKALDIEAGIDYSREVVHVEEIAIKRESREVEMQLREIMVEIKKLTDSSKELQVQFKSVAIEQHSVAPGKYHKNFFSWLLSVIRAARMKVEDSGAWLQAMHSKKKSREYGAMAKKQGTSFTLNNERTVATQVG